MDLGDCLTHLGGAMFKPSEAQSRAKVRFHSAVASNALIGDPQKLSMPRIAKLSSVGVVDQWFAQDGFERRLACGDENYCE